jgi:hypothetical protein
VKRFRLPGAVRDKYGPGTNAPMTANFECASLGDAYIAGTIWWRGSVTIVKRHYSLDRDKVPGRHTGIAKSVSMLMIDSSPWCDPHRRSAKGRY